MAFSDYRVQSIGRFIDYVQRLKPLPDLILYAGDDIGRFVELDRESSKITSNYFEAIAQLSTHGICAVIGNDDSSMVKQYVKGNKVYNVHDEPLTFGDYTVIGLEGAIYDPDESENAIGFTLHDDKSVKKHLEHAIRKAGNRKLIIVSHTPPYGILDFALRFGQRHVGSKVLKNLVSKNSHRIPLVVCGHVHLQGGRHEIVKGTAIVNAASHDYEGSPGNVAIIDLFEDGSCNITWEKIEEGIGLYGVGPVKTSKLAAAGIHKAEHILALSPEELSQKIGCGLHTAQSLHLRARSVVENQIIVLKPLIALNDNPIFLDIETDLTQSLVWLIGVYFLKDGKFVQYLADKPSDEKSMLRRFLKETNGIKGTIYTFSGTHFDERVLKKRIAANGFDAGGLPPFIDICTDLRRSVIFPVQSYGLKDVADYYGYKYRHPDLNGIRVAMEYLITYQKNKDKALLKRLLEYNEDDIRSLPVIVSKVVEVAGAINIARTTELAVDISVSESFDANDAMEIVRKHYRQCGGFQIKSRGNELRFRTKDPNALAEIKTAMSMLGYESGSYQRYDGRGYLPYYGSKLVQLMKRIEG